MKLTSLKVNNFKSLNNLEIENIGLINLISGDNNIGKTSLLEALLIDEDLSITLSNLNFILKHKYDDLFIEDGKFDLMTYFSNYWKLNQNNEIEVEYKYVNGKDRMLKLAKKSIDKLTDLELSVLKNKKLYDSKKNKNTVVLYDNNRPIEARFMTDFNDVDDEYVPIILFNDCYKTDLVEFYSNYIQKDISTRRKFMEQLGNFIDGIESLELAHNELTDETDLFVLIHGSNNLVPLASFGEGTLKTIRILLELCVCKSKKLMIDEIDSGIHYSRFAKYWEMIIVSAIQNDVQIYATTHSLECMNYLKQVLVSNRDEFGKLFRYILLSKGEDGTTKSYTYSFEQFEIALKNENEIRGGF